MTLIEFVKGREGRVHDNGDGTVSSYWDPYGKVWTIGYGTTGPHIVQGTVWTYQQCDDALGAKLSLALTQLLSVTPNRHWPDGAQDALNDFVYNEGIGHYAGSTVRKCVDVADWVGVKSHLLDWEFAGGKKLAGLVARREAEAAMIQLPLLA